MDGRPERSSGRFRTGDSVGNGNENVVYITGAVHDIISMTSYTPPAPVHDIIVCPVSEHNPVWNDFQIPLISLRARLWSALSPRTKSLNPSCAIEHQTSGTIISLFQNSGAITLVYSKKGAV